MPSLPELESLARQAGEILRKGFGNDFHVEHKATTIDLVTEMDRQTEAFLLGIIQARYPDHNVIAEERGEIVGTSQKTWYIDPLDGTVNYTHNLPIFSVSIAYGEGDKILLGVVYDPVRDEFFSAERGKGARLNGKPLHASENRTLNESLLVTGFPYDIRENPQNNLDHFARFTLRSRGVRRLGSAAIDLSYLAAGRFDGYWELRLNTWDIAAGALIAEEAGAVVTQLDGTPDWLCESPSILAANQYVHPQMLEVLEGKGQGFNGGN